MQKTINRIRKPKEPKKESNLEILITKEQVAQIQQLQVQINEAQNRQGLYIRAILDSQGVGGDVKIAGPTERGNKWFLEVVKFVNPKKNGEV